MATKAQTQAKANLIAELKGLQEDFQRDWVEGSLPKAWDEVPVLFPVEPERVKITTSLDKDMVNWFRKLGRGYQARINAVLRIYWQALLSGQVKSHWDAEAVGPKEHSLLEDALRMKIEDMRSGGAEDLGKLEQELSEGLALVQRLHQKEG